MPPRFSHIRIRPTAPDPSAPPCITCNKPNARYPRQAASPRFCNKSCAAFYAIVIANDWAWCRTHLTYWDRLGHEQHCPKCPYVRRAGALQATMEEVMKQVSGNW